MSGHIETKEDEFKAAKQVHDKLNVPIKTSSRLSLLIVVI